MCNLNCNFKAKLHFFDYFSLFREEIVTMRGNVTFPADIPSFVKRKKGLWKTTFFQVTKLQI